MFNAFALLSLEWTMLQIMHCIKFLDWKYSDVKKWTNIMSDVGIHVTVYVATSVKQFEVQTLNTVNRVNIVSSV